MSCAATAHEGEPQRRRYVVHLSCAVQHSNEVLRYVARVRPWASRRSTDGSGHERVFVDDCELIATINPLLPSGSDVRDVFDHIESPSGFYYLLLLTQEEAELLGWRP